jgi:uncharacterized paraquat-inducible protein A
MRRLRAVGLALLVVGLASLIVSQILGDALFDTMGAFGVVPFWTSVEYTVQAILAYVASVLIPIATISLALSFRKVSNQSGRVT